MLLLYIGIVLEQEHQSAIELLLLLLDATINSSEVVRIIYHYT